MPITKDQINRVLGQPDPWVIGNQTLYDLCSLHPDHSEDSAIVAKVWLIGRAYAASIERARSGGLGAEAPNDRFYVEVVAPELRRSALDRHLAAVRDLNPEDPQRLRAVLEAHGFLVGLFKKLTNKSKRSLASKYLHFHVPDAFFIYDSRAVSAMRLIAPRPESLPPSEPTDPEYAKFVASAIGLQLACAVHGIQASPRDIDRLLLARFAEGSV